MKIDRVTYQKAYKIATDLVDNSEFQYVYKIFGTCCVAVAKLPKSNKHKSIDNTYVAWMNYDSIQEVDKDEFDELARKKIIEDIVDDLYPITVSHES